MRQTGLSLREIKDHFERQCTLPYPRCLLINELGQIARSTEPETMVEAQKVLVGLLKSESDEDRWISIQSLRDIQAAGIATPDVVSAIVDFEANPMNANILRLHRPNYRH